jgi:hypothetical protein
VKLGPAAVGRARGGATSISHLANDGQMPRSRSEGSIGFFGESQRTGSSVPTLEIGLTGRKKLLMVTKIFVAHPSFEVTQKAVTE